MEKPENISLIKAIETATGTHLALAAYEDVIAYGNTYNVDLSENITGLNLESSKLSDISFLRHLPHLQQLFLSGTGIQDITILATLKNVQHLALDNNPGVSDFSPIAFLPSLNYLSLKRNSISDISFLKKSTSLVHLNLNQNQISDVALLDNLKELKKLQLDFNQIRILPKEVAFLEKLSYLSINGNPLERPPFSATLNLENIRDYFQKTVNQNNLDPSIHKPPKQNKIFICYAHADKQWLKQVQNNLRALAHYVDDIDIWDDTRIRPGIEWKTQIEKGLKEANIAILLISTNFLISEFIIKSELPSILASRQNRGMVVIPLILSSCLFDEHPTLSKFQAINDPKTELLSELSKSKRDKILVRLAREVKAIIEGNSTSG